MKNFLIFLSILVLVTFMSLDVKWKLDNANSCNITIKAPTQVSVKSSKPNEIDLDITDKQDRKDLQKNN